MKPPTPSKTLIRGGMKRKGIKAKFARPESRLIGSLATADEIRNKALKCASDDMEQMERLRDEYGIPDTLDKWYCLALELARENYPASKPKRKKWGKVVIGALVVDVEILMEERGVTETSALAIICKRKHWMDFVTRADDNDYGQPSPSSLKTYYQRGKTDQTTNLMRELARVGRYRNDQQEDPEHRSKYKKFVVELLANPYGFL